MLLRVVHIKELCAWWGSKRLQEKFHWNLTFTFLNDYLKVSTCWRMSSFFPSILVSGRYKVKVQERQYTAKMEQRTVRDLQCNSCFSWKSILLRWYVVSDLQRNSKRTRLWKKSHKKCILHSNYLDPSGSKTSLVWKCLSGENVRSVKMFIRWKCSFGPRFLTFCYSLLQLTYYSASGLNHPWIMGLQVDDYAT